MLLFWLNSSLLYRAGYLVGLNAVHELPVNNLFSEEFLIAFSAFPIFQGGPKPLANLEVTSETEKEQNFLRVFQPLPSNI